MEKRGILVSISVSVLFLLLAISIVSASVESDFLSLINNERSKMGKSVLTYNDNLNSAAYSHSYEMAENDYFSHDSLDGTSFDKRIVSFGYNSMSLGENIAYASGDADASRVFGMWKNSPPHYANMIDGSFNEIGLGIYSKNGLTYYTLDFGKRTNIIPPVITPPVTPPAIMPPATNPGTPDNPTSVLFSSLNSTESKRGTYRFIKVNGNLNKKSAVNYYLDGKIHRVCSQCTKFSFNIRTKASSLQLNITAKEKTGNTETRILSL